MNDKEPIKSVFVPKIDIRMYTREEEVEKRLLRGRVLLDSDEGTMLFAQNEKRTRYSKELMRTDHGRLVRRPDGLYTYTFSMLNIEETALGEQLLSEVRSATRKMKDDHKKQVALSKKEVKEGGEK